MPNKSETYKQAIRVITKEQEKIIGKRIARALSEQVSELSFDKNDNPIFTSKADPKKVLEELVQKYSLLFGQASLEISKDAIKSLSFKSSELPNTLK